MYMELSWDNRKQYLSMVPHRSQVLFALFCARQVEYIWKDNKKCRVAIDVVERWLEGKATVKECGAAANATNAAANAANATNAANAAYAAANAAYAAAYAATYAYYAAANAATYAYYAAANAATTEEVKQQQVEYLRNLYLDSLPEEERNCWLVQACL
jgi:hypothetical protein